MYVCIYILYIYIYTYIYIYLYDIHILLHTEYAGCAAWSPTSVPAAEGVEDVGAMVVHVAQAHNIAHPGGP